MFLYCSNDTMRVLLFLVCMIPVCVECVLHTTSSTDPITEQEFEVNDEPLILTPLIEEGCLCEARRLSKVTPNILGTLSYSGYFTVNKTCENHLFFWFFLAEKNWTEAPVVLWLQGGPGAPSLYGLFEENGPFVLVDGEPQRRPSAWNKKHNLIYIDQPVNTGFSFSGKKCYTSSSRQCGLEIYSALVQFFTMFSELVDNRFYIMGESYAGHYVPQVGKAIHEFNPFADTKINLSGMMVWSPYIDYIRNVNSSYYLYNLGLIDLHEKKELDERLEKYVNAMKVEPFRPPNPDENVIDLWRTLLKNISFYDYYSLQNQYNRSRFAPYVIQPKLRTCLHVGNVSLGLDEDRKIFKAMNLDYYSSMSHLYEELLEHYTVVTSVGQLDLACGYPTVMNILDSLEWSGAEAYRNATRQRWYVDGQLVGFHKCAGNVHNLPST